MTCDNEDDRKILEVTSSLLSYARRELAQLNAPQPELMAAIEAASLLSRASLENTAPSGGEIRVGRRRPVGFQ